MGKNKTDKSISDLKLTNRQVDQHLACPTLVGVAKGRSDAGGCCADAETVIMHL
jgi:hypothetical protein